MCGCTQVGSLQLSPDNLGINAFDCRTSSLIIYGEVCGPVASAIPSPPHFGRSDFSFLSFLPHYHVPSPPYKGCQIEYILPHQTPRHLFSPIENLSQIPYNPFDPRPSTSLTIDRFTASSSTSDHDGKMDANADGTSNSTQPESIFREGQLPQLQLNAMSQQRDDSMGPIGVLRDQQEG